MNKWGSIAVGVRVGHSPDAEFFRSWTRLLCGGLQACDEILPPAIGMPHHTAANCIMDAFLKGKSDSLLYIDDDMVFTQDSVERLRSSGDDYSAVMGLCLSRAEGHRPVILNKIDGIYVQPGTTTAEHVGIIPADVVGLAFTLIRRDIAAQVKIANDNGECFAWMPKMSEDAYFSQCAISQGGKLGINCDVKIGHRMKQVLYPIVDGIKYSTRLSTGG